MDDSDGAVSLKGRIGHGEVQNIILNERTPAHEIGTASGKVVKCTR
jgi:hypothetical protein